MDEFEITSTVTHHITNKIKEELCLGYINNVQTIDDNIWKIKIHKKRTKELIVTPKVCFISKNNIPVSEIKGFEKYLKKKLYNQRIKNIYQEKNNKVICFVLDKYYLIFEFFSKSNIILTDLDFKIITSKQKEEWKDRTIKKGDIYNFPAGEDIKLKEIKDVKEEINNLENKEIIRLLSKKYNIAPVEINDILLNKKNLINQIFLNYNLEDPKIKEIIKNGKKTFLISDQGKDIFETFEKIYVDKYQSKEILVEDKKKNKSETILKAQKEKEEEIKNNINKLEKEGEFIYSNFTLIENINKQIQIAINKNIPTKEIITKINNYFKNNNLNLKINSINQKNRTYEIEN